MDVSENDRLAKLAERYGVDSDGINVEDLFVALCTINAMQNGTLEDLAALIGLLGEDTVEKKTESAEYDALTLSLIEEARRLENADKP
mgnify:CR=1 FL=1